MTTDRRAILAWVAACGLVPALPFRMAFGDGRKPRVIDVRIARRKVISPKGTIRVNQQDVIELRFDSDERVQLHLHGYDKEVTASPGKPGILTLTVHATGRFPITSHGWGHGGHGHHALTYLEVHPR